MAEPQLSRRDRLQAAKRLDELASEIEMISLWLDKFGQDADKAALLLESAARDLYAACWIVRPADHERLALGWQSVTDGQRAL